MAIEAGADALGFVFWKNSARAVSVRQAAAIIRDLPPFVMKTGVFVNPEESLVTAAIREAGINLLQFHGEESPEFCVQFGIMAMKAFRVKDESFVEELVRYQTEAFLLDAFSASAPGGTGERFDWDLATRAHAVGKPFFLAGGLNPANVAEAIARVHPFGVDVSSGVETAPGCKDPIKLRAFVRAAKET